MTRSGRASRASAKPLSRITSGETIVVERETEAPNMVNYAVYDDLGNYVNESVPYTVGPNATTAVIIHQDFARRKWRLNPTIRTTVAVGQFMASPSSAGSRVDLR